MLKKITTLLLLILVIPINSYSQSKNIQIKTDHLEPANYLQMDDFYLTHYLYIDLFLRENLYLEVTSEDVSTILKAIKTYVSVENKLDIEIQKPGKNNYLIRMAILKNDDGTELLIAFTNWSVKKRKFEKDIKIENDCYTRWYFLNGNKMTYRKDMSNKNDYSTMSQSDLANAYLFDELTENDADIKSTINGVLKKEDLNSYDKIMANLLLLKYQMFQKDWIEVEKQTTFLEQLFETNATESNLKGLQMAFNATKFQIKLMKK